MIDHGITIVISPLLSLMNNQVTALKKAGIAVATLNSNTPPSERTEILDDLKCGRSCCFHPSILKAGPSHLSLCVGAVGASF